MCKANYAVYVNLILPSEVRLGLPDSVIYPYQCLILTKRA